MQSGVDAATLDFREARDQTMPWMEVDDDGYDGADLLDKFLICDAEGSLPIAFIPIEYSDAIAVAKGFNLICFQQCFPCFPERPVWCGGGEIRTIAILLKSGGYTYSAPPGTRR